MPEAGQPSGGELILYQTPEGAVRIEVLYEGDTFWLNQSLIAERFGVTVSTVSHHLSEIYNSGELRPEATLRRILRVQTQGTREVRREIESDFEMEVKRIESRRKPKPPSGGTQ